MKNSTYLTIITFLLFASCIRNSTEPMRPSVIGTPPQNAYTGLVSLDNEEIRHYGPNMYISSMDNGIKWDTVFVPDGKLYGKKDPISGEFIRIYSGNKDSVYAIRSVGGIDGKWTKTLIDTNGAIMIKPMVYIRNGTRAIAGFHTKYRNGCGVYYSDDSGLTWKKSNQVHSPAHKAEGFHKGQRWNHGAVEPSVVELKDGRLWMLIRTAQDNLYESFSENAGESWSTPVPSRFYGTITMPTIQRLKNGSLLLIWCNTTPLPEVKHTGGYWEDVFTNRDALHATISDDDGKTWTGFREIYLNPLRNDSLMATRYGTMGSLDRSVHQSELIEIDEDKVLIAFGQHPKFRKILTLDLNWLYEKESFDNFSNGLAHWSYHKYIKGIKGHCAYNRKPGAFLISHPEKPNRKVMLLKAESDSTLLGSYRGALFNFPAGQKGEIQLRIKINKGFEGMLMSLHDRWFNPIDTVAKHYSMFNVKIEEEFLNPDIWYDLKLEWKNANNDKTGYCNLFIDDKMMKKIPIENKSRNGISYIHFSLPLIEDVNEGILIESIITKIE
ncbi:glycoside hydrolase [Saprospiraceae bacterium]|nr:glycoside hydrolase [Saprospiraceae bacterium]